MFSQTIIIGNLGKDVDLRYTPDGVPVASFSVATSEHWTDKNGAPQERTTWFKVTTWNKLADNCAQFLHKGSKVMVIGRIATSAWTNQAGEPQATLELTASTVKFLSPKGEGENGGNNRSQQAGHPSTIDEEEVPF